MFSRFLKHQTGQVGVLASMVVGPLVAVLGGAVDVSMAHQQRVAVQRALDKAVLVAAKAEGEDLLRAAQGEGIFSANYSGDCGDGPEFTFEDGVISAVARCPQKNHFLSLLGLDSFILRVEARAGVREPGVITNPLAACLILVLDTESSDSLTMNGSGRIEAPDCLVQINASDEAETLTSTDSPSIVAQELCSSGGWRYGGRTSYSVDPETCDAMPDPLSDLAIPPEVEEECDFRDMKINRGIVALTPGVYCGGLDIGGNSIVSMLPGTYVLRDGGLSTKGNALLAGAGVTLYFENGAVAFDMGGNATYELLAPVTGPLKGVVAFAARDADGMTARLGGSSESTMAGVVYLPSTTLQVLDNAVITRAAEWTTLIVNRLEIDDDGQINIQSHVDTSIIPIPDTIETEQTIGEREVWLAG